VNTTGSATGVDAEEDDPADADVPEDGPAALLDSAEDRDEGEPPAPEVQAESSRASAVAATPAFVAADRLEIPRHTRCTVNCSANPSLPARRGFQPSDPLILPYRSSRTGKARVTKALQPI
jgi:hypothetical protein